MPRWKISEPPQTRKG